MGAYRWVEVGLPGLLRGARRRPRGFVVNAVVVALMFVLAGPALADGGAISGRVTDAQGNGLSDVSVWAADLTGPIGAGGDGSVDAMTWTPDSGRRLSRCASAALGTSHG